MTPIQKIPTRSLVIGDLPLADSSWDAINRFALTYDFNTEQGEVTFEEFQPDRLGATSTLAALRSALYHEQRRLAHYGRPPEGPDLAYWRQIVEWMRAQLRP